MTERRKCGGFTYVPTRRGLEKENCSVRPEDRVVVLVPFILASQSALSGAPAHYVGCNRAAP
jgi:hypothetical protein